MKFIRFFLILIFFNISLIANVTLQSPNTFIKGESFIFEFEVVGSSVKFPKIEKIDGFIVESLGSSRSLQIINGNYNEKISKKFRIVPTKEFTIPSFTFSINGKEVNSQEKIIEEKVVTKTKSNNFDLTLSASKTSLYVGEDLLVKLVFKYRRGLQITNLGFEQPHFENFWYKKLDNSNKSYEQNGYVVQELEFLLFPQKTGKLKIPSLRVDVQLIDPNNQNFGFFANSTKSLKVYSNELVFDVKELPNNLTLIGDFDINASVNKTKIKQGESISYKINISGKGNFDDIEDIKLAIENVTIYDNKPEINTKYTNKGYEGTYSKVYSIIPSSSFEIPSITFRYFSKKDNKVIEKKTKTFNIEIIDQIAKKVVLEKPKEIIDEKEKIIVKNQSSLKENILYFILGVFVTLLIIGLISYVRLQRLKNQKDEKPLIKLVKRSKDKKSLMKVLIPFLKIDSNLDKLIFQCESEKDFKILKKQIIDLLKQLKI